MAPFFTGFTRGVGGSGFGANILRDIPIPVTFTVETFGAGGAVEFENISGYPRYGYGGYNKVSVTALSKQTGYVQIAGSGRRCYSSFYIDGQWIVVAGGGGEPASNVRWEIPGFSNAYTVSGSNGGDGEGFYSLNGGGPQGGGGERYADTLPSYGEWWVSGAYGSGAPPVSTTNPNSPYSLIPGPGGKGNIRCYNDSGVTSGIVGNNICTMSFVSSATGVNNGPAKVIVTNTLTGRSMTYNQPTNYNDAFYTFSISDIISY
jgi:hypothetical protein